MTTYITLPWNDPSCLKGSTPGNYIVQFGKSLDFSGGAHEAFLREARFRIMWHNVEASENNLVLSANFVPPCYYESVPRLCGVLKALFKGKGVVFIPLPLKLQVQIRLPAGQTLQGPALRLLSLDLK